MRTEQALVLSKNPIGPSINPTAHTLVGNSGESALACQDAPPELQDYPPTWDISTFHCSGLPSMGAVLLVRCSE